MLTGLSAATLLHLGRDEPLGRSSWASRRWSQLWGCGMSMLGYKCVMESWCMPWARGRPHHQQALCCLSKAPRLGAAVTLCSGPHTMVSFHYHTDPWHKHPGQSHSPILQTRKLRLRASQISQLQSCTLESAVLTQPEVPRESHIHSRKSKSTEKQQ